MAATGRDSVAAGPPGCAGSRVLVRSGTTITGMALSIAEYNRLVLAWLAAHWGPNPPCPMCKTQTGWELLPLAEWPIRAADLDGQVRGQAIPVVPLLCKNCAYLVALNAVRLGILQPAAPPSPAEGETA